MEVYSAFDKECPCLVISRLESDGSPAGDGIDQEGVQLGKLLAKKVLAHETDGALKELSDMLNI